MKTTGYSGENPTSEQKEHEKRWQRQNLETVKIDLNFIFDTKSKQIQGRK